MTYSFGGDSAFSAQDPNFRQDVIRDMYDLRNLFFFERVFLTVRPVEPENENVFKQGPEDESFSRRYCTLTYTHSAWADFIPVLIDTPLAVVQLYLIRQKVEREQINVFACRLIFQLSWKEREKLWLHFKYTEINVNA